MTITVTAPNGATVQFPDGTDHDTINGVMIQHFAPDAKAPAVAAPPDKYQQAAIDEAKSNPAIDDQAGYMRRLVHGATLGADSTIAAGLFAPLEAMRHGVGLGEGYNYAKAREDRTMDESRKNTGLLGSATEMLGGAFTGGGLAKGGVTAARALAPDAGLAARSLASAADASGIGAVSGFNEGNSLGERLTNAAKGAGTGALIGGALPGAAALVKGVAAPIFANIRARANPEGFASSQIARAVSESGQTPQQLGRAVEDANNAGQPLTLADALGPSGQKMLAAAARGPGEGNTNITRFLNERQAGQGERVANIIDEGLGAGGSARQTMDQLTAQARAESAPLYREALDKQPVWNDRMNQFFSDPATAQGLKEGVGVQRLESLASGRKFDPNDYAITHFNEAGDPMISGVPNMRTINLIKKGWDQMLEKYRDPTTGRLALDEKGRALDQVRRAFLNEVDGLNPAYGQARAAYAGPAQVREAVGVGAQAATRGRAVDNIARFEALTDPSKQGYRAGYADTRVGAIERAAPGNNAVRPLSSQKAQAELDALSLHQGPVAPGQAAPMQQRLNNEQTMFETRNRALGNSKTAENLADDAAMGIEPHLVSVVGHILHGNVGGALAGVGKLVANGWSGNTPAVRAAVARILLDRGVNPANLQAAVGQTVARIQFMQNLTRNVGRGAAGALAVARPNQS